MNRLFIIIFVLFLFSQGAQAFTYSYAASGKEVLIDGREAIYAGLARGDQDGAALALRKLTGEVEFLNDFYDDGLIDDFEAVQESLDPGAITAFLNRTFAAEVERRLSSGAGMLDDYQRVKIKVAKAGLFLEAIAGDLEPENLTAAKEGMAAAMQAIGSPGLFGAGQKPADPDAYKQAVKQVITALGQ